MTILMTGLHGTLAPIVATHASLEGHVVVPLDRDLIDIEDEKQLHTFIKEVNPDFIFHIGMGSISFTRSLATLSKTLNIQFLYTSTVMVFDGNGQGPFDPSTMPTPNSEYGKYKYDSEKVIVDILKDAYIIRLGWQIGNNTSGNQMIAQLKQEYLEKGYNEASEDVYLACSWMTESAKAIVSLIKEKPGFYHFDQNDYISMFDLLTYLKTIHPWITPKKVKSTPYNNQMIDTRLTHHKKTGQKR